MSKSTGSRTMSKPVCLVVCTGKDCRADKGFAELVDAAADVKHAHQAPCQGLCHGPIAGVVVGGEMHWFARVRTKALRRALLDLVRTGHTPKALREHETRKHHGRLRHRGRLRSISR